MSNETKVGLLAVIVIAISIFGYNFLKGVNILSAPNLLYATYNNVASLTVSSPIIINGLQVGVVKDIYFQEDMQTIEVEMNIEKDFKIPKNAQAVITSMGLMGGTAVYIKYKGICSGGGCAQSGDYLNGQIASALEAFIGEPEELNPYFDSIKRNVGPILDTVKTRLSDPNSDDALSKSIRDIAVVLENLKTTTANLNRMVLANSKPLNDMLKNAESLTGNLKANNQSIQGIIQNADSLTGNIADLELKNTLDSANVAIASLKSTMQSADQAVGELTQLLQKINQGEGAIGRLMTDETIITQFKDAAFRLDTFLTDFQERPYRYMPLKSRKKVKKFDKLDSEGK